jgi:hypothetical protein
MMSGTLQLNVSGGSEADFQVGLALHVGFGSIADIQDRFVLERRALARLVFSIV